MLTDAKEQDFSTFIASLASNRRTTRKVATFVKEHFDEASFLRSFLPN